MMSEDTHDLPGDDTPDETPYNDPMHWQPDRPCRPEVQSVVAFICDSLDAQELDYDYEQDDPENPNCFSFMVDDEDGRSTLGLVGWNDESASVVYGVFDPVRYNHDIAEGFTEDESKCWWKPNSAVMMVAALDGTVHEVMEQDRARKLEALDKESEEAA